MRAVLAGVVLAATAGLFLAPAAVAGPYTVVGFGPESDWVDYHGATAVHPNMPVTFVAWCDEPHGPVVSPLFGSTVLRPEQGAWTGQARVPLDAKSGDYPVSFMCGDRKRQVTISVDGVGDSTGPAPTSTTTSTQPATSTSAARRRRDR